MDAHAWIFQVRRTWKDLNVLNCRSKVDKSHRVVTEEINILVVPFRLASTEVSKLSPKSLADYRLWQPL